MLKLNGSSKYISLKKIGNVTEMPCKYTLKQVESNLANVRSRSRTINVLEVHCTKSDCHGIPFISSYVCREKILDVLSEHSRQRIELISFHYISNGSTMRMDIMENAAVELQNLGSGSRNAIQKIQKSLAGKNGENIRNKKESQNENDNLLCIRCQHVQKRELTSLISSIKRNPLEAKKKATESKDLIQYLGKVNKNNGCRSCISGFIGTCTSPKNIGSGLYYKDYAYTGETDYDSLYPGIITRTNVHRPGIENNKEFRDYVVDPYIVKGYQVYIKRNKKKIAGQEIATSDFNLYGYSVSLGTRIIALMNALSDEIKDVLLERRPTGVKSVEDMRIELQSTAIIKLERLIKKPDWDDLADTGSDEKNLIAWLAIDSVQGYGILTPLIYDPNVTDIEIKEVADDVYKITCRHLYSRPKKMCVVDVNLNKTEIENLVKNIVPRIAGTVGDTALFKNDTLETAGMIEGMGKIRCTINRPPITKGYHLELRKHAKKLSIPELMALGEAPVEAFSLLWIFALLSKMSMMFVGPVGSGKTTLLVAAQSCAPESLVWGVVGDIDELEGISGDYVLFKTISGDSESREKVRKKLLRKRKEKVIIQEIRDSKDAEDYVSQRQQSEAILSTTHARSIEEVVDRFKFNFGIPEEYVYKSFDALVVMNERSNLIIETIGVIDHQNENDRNKIYRMFEFDYNDGSKWYWKNRKGEITDFASSLRDLSTLPCVRNALIMQETPMSTERLKELVDLGVFAINELFDKCFTKQSSGLHLPIRSDREIFKLTKICMQTAYDLYMQRFDITSTREGLKAWLEEM